jgi:hypothetical protein
MTSDIGECTEATKIFQSKEIILVDAALDYLLAVAAHRDSKDLLFVLLGKTI